MTPFPGVSLWQKVYGCACRFSLDKGLYFTLLAGTDGPVFVLLGVSFEVIFIKNGKGVLFDMYLRLKISAQSNAFDVFLRFYVK